MSADRWLRVILGLTLAALVANGAVAFRNAADLAASGRWVRHTRDVIASLGAISAAVRAGGGARDPAPTGGRPALAAAVEAEASRLRALTADNPAQARRVAALQAELGAWAGSLTRPGPPDRRAADAALELTDQARLAEADLLGRRAAAVDAALARAAGSFLLASGLALALLGLAFILVRRGAAARRRWGQTLRASEDQIRLLLDSTGEGIYGVDTRGRCTFINRAGLVLLGYDDPAEVLGRDMHALAHHTRSDGSPYAVTDCPIYNAMRDGTAAHSDDERLFRADGTGFPAEYRARPVVRDGMTLGGVVTFADVTARREWQERLLRSEQRYRSLVEATSAIVWSTTAAGEFDGDQPGWEAFTGQPLKASRGLGWLDCVHPDDRGDVAEAWRLAVAGRTPYHSEHRLRRSDGAYRRMSARAVPLPDPDGGVREWVGVHADVTEQKEAEEALVVAKEAAEAASRSKSTFLANMSHELRTPLNAIIGYSEMLQEEAEEAGRAEVVSDLGKIHSAGRHLLGLINDVLDLSKIEAGRMDLYLETFDAANLVRGVAETVRPLVGRNGNTLDVDCPDDLGTVRADLTKTRQALLNLLSNATKFTERGHITLSAARERDPAAGGGEWLVVRVTDTGIGMSPDQLDRLFRPFSQADASTTRKYGGTGLGLTITRRFCQLMGGDVTVRSEEGVGSTFTLRLPSVVPDRPEPAESDAADIAGPDGVGPLILVIDDDRTVRDLMRRTLEREGFRVREAAGGAEGLRLAREVRPDAITLDVMMPGLDGWSVLSLLKSDAEVADIPVVVVTIVDDRNLGFALGAAEFLTKPIDRRRLAGVLGRFRRNGAAPGAALVVDDDPVSRRVLLQALVGEGWAVTEAENGRDAFDRMAKSPPDLIVLDLMMPEMDGFKFADELRRDPRWRDVPVLVVTAKDLTDDDRARLNGRVLAVLGKGSSTRAELLSQIRRRLGDRPRRDGAPPA